MIVKKLSITIVLLLLLSKSLYADTPVFNIEIKDHLFHPAEIIVPAHIKVKLIIHNLDMTTEEFESYELNREKIILGKRKGIVFIGPLEPGEYPYFGEFYPETALGKIIAR